MLQELDASEGNDENEHGETAHDSTSASKKEPLQRGYMVGRVALRTVFFDTKLLDAVTSGPPAAIKQVCLQHQASTHECIPQGLACADAGTAAALCGDMSWNCAMHSGSL